MNFELEKRIAALFLEMKTLLSILIVASLYHSFFFIYGFLLLIDCLAMLNPYKYPNKKFDHSKGRIQIINCNLKAIQPILENNEREVIKTLWKAFPKLILDENYFVIMKKLVKVNAATFYHINNPGRQSYDNINDFTETEKCMSNIVDKSKTSLYSFNCYKGDQGITLPNGEIGIAESTISEAEKTFKGKYYLSTSLYHEHAHAHEKGRISYKRIPYLKDLINDEKLFEDF